MLDHFELRGGEHSHRALVLEVVGEDLWTRTERLTTPHWRRNLARSLCSDILLGLDYIWKCGISHAGE